MTLKPQCDCSTCDACGNAPGRSGYCLNCEVTDSGAPGTHAQHTPGPWTVGSGDAQGPKGVFVGEGDNRKAVAMLTGTFVPRNGYAVDEGDDGWPHERTANARLIAAAPAMLEALRDCRESLEAALEHITKDGMTDEHEELYYLGIAASDNAKAALAAAEGPGDTQS